MTDTPATPRDTVVRWTQTLVEPLLPLEIRSARERRMRQVCADHPTWASLVLGGTLADIVLSLPDNDPWRTASSRLGRTTHGDTPPARDGARLPDGARLGTWRSFVDTLGAPAEEDLTLDPSYAPIAAELAPVSEAIIGFAAGGWESGAAGVSAAVPRGSSTSAVDDLADLPGIQTLHPSPIYTYTVPALRWATYRRRSYGTSADDAWVSESLYRWSWRAGRILGGMSWDEHMVDSLIAAERLEPISDEPF
ncbi:hypothetical protein GCM10009584_14420 [Ornithinimicrobium humiphilum]|uniref:Uncharacterized protein n=1 Tax=Ornithinimicrobium humiphilum TaxID=125288 RepID=A0A543KKG4_9MICO|nr:hypothetical protein [Ornithinimicrobium humiphilum]TQM95534.1 hypothetical protein FB476_0378 [Ornithinimicrobium humiphilum]